MSDESIAATVLSVFGSDADFPVVLVVINPEGGDLEEIQSVIMPIPFAGDTELEPAYDVNAWIREAGSSPKGQIVGVDSLGYAHVGHDSRWTTLDLGCRSGLDTVWVAGESDFFAGGYQGERVRVRGQFIESVSDSKRRKLFEIRGSSPACVFAVGAEGVIWHYDGRTWHELESPTNYTLMSVAPLSAEEFFVGGVKGLLFHYQQGRWGKIVCAEDMSITSICWFRDRLYVAAGTDGVFALHGDRLESLKKLYILHLSVVNDHLFGYADEMVYRFNGSVWEGTPITLG